MTAFTATQPWSVSTFTTEWYTLRPVSTVYTMMPWVVFSYTVVQPVKVFRGAQVKKWNGSAWVLAPSS